jgi:homoserine kinase
MYRSAKVFAPARPTEEVGRVSIRAIHHDDGRLPREAEKNTAGVAAMQVLRNSGFTDVGIELEIFKKMPFGSGMGSSAASAVAGAMATNEALGRPFGKPELLEPSVLGEQVADGARHADNVGPSLFGGFILIRDNETLDYHRIPSPAGLYCVLVHPNLTILTEEARAILRDKISLKDHIRQSGNLGALILALYKGDFELLGRSLKDHIIEPQRSKLITGFGQVKEAAIESGALGFGISGAGPSVFAFSENSLSAEEVARQICGTWKAMGIESQSYISEINKEGSILL